MYCGTRRIGLICFMLAVVFFGTQSVIDSQSRQTDMMRLVEKRWQAERIYRTALSDYINAFKVMAKTYQKVKEVGESEALLRKAAGVVDAVDRQTADIAMGYLAGEVAKELGAASVKQALTVVQLAECLHWAKLNAEMWPSTIKNWYTYFRSFKPALERVEKTSRDLEKAKGSLYSTRRSSRSLNIDLPRPDQVVWDGIIRGTATPDRRVDAYIGTNTLYKQGSTVADSKGNWTVKGVPTKGTVNVIFAIEFDKKGRGICFSGEKAIPRNWRKPRK
jgi:hypothetical protein